MEFDFSRYSKIVANDLSLNGSISSALGGLSQWSSSGDNIYFSNGNVGIGTASPSSKLHIQHDQSSMPTGQNFNHDGTLILENKHANTVLNYGANIKFVQRWNSTADTAIEMGAIAGYSGFDGGFGGGLTFWTHSNGNFPLEERMRITDNGNVGIGTTNPVNKLHIYSTANTSNFRVSNSTSTLGLIVEQSTNKYTYIRNTESIGGIIFHAGNGERMRIMPDGKVSIHPTGVNPSFQLDVWGQILAYHTIYGNANVQLAGRLYKINGTQDFNPYTGYTTARFQEAIIAKSFFAYSDSRIKTNIQEVNDSSALDKLRLLKPSLYNYIDVLARGEKQVYGFLAQEVKEVLPDAVSQYPEFIPNIYSFGTYDVSTNIITIQNENYDSASLSMDASNNVYKNIKIYDASDNVIEVCIEEIIGTKEIKIKQDSEVNITSSIFAYGQEVDDFHKLNKDAVFTVATAALQEVDRQQQADKIRITSLESQLTDEKAKVASLESQLADVLQRLTNAGI